MGAAQACVQKRKPGAPPVFAQQDGLHYQPPRLTPRARKLDVNPTFGGDVAVRLSPDALLEPQRRSLDWCYDVRHGKAIGAGAFGTVLRIAERGTGTRRAVKVMNKRGPTGLEKALAVHELEIVKVLDHPHIVRLVESFDDPNHISMVMECCFGGDMQQYVTQNGALCEKNSAFVMSQLLSGLLYLHQTHRIVHRDVKLQNVLLEQCGPISRNCVKLIDFGLAKQLEGDKRLFTCCGTKAYVAPERRFGNGYTEAVDLWASGVVLYALLCQQMPFKEESQGAKGQFATPFIWKQLSLEAKNFVRGLLTVDPDKRFTAMRALSQAWVSRHAQWRTHIEDDCRQSTLRSLRSYAQQHRLKKAALRIMAQQAPPQEVKHLRSTFETLDMDKDGEVKLEQLSWRLRSDEDSEEEMAMLLQEVDSDGSGSIGLTEFLAATLDEHLYLKESFCAGAFRVLDKNGDGQISADDLAPLVQPVDAGDKEHLVRELMREVDLDQDGTIDFDEFVALMRSSGMH